MNVEIRPLAEINQKATDILIREMGVVDTLRFLKQFRAGSGDYTAERGQWLDGLTLEQIASEITDAIRGRAHELKDKLAYPEDEAKAILVGALAQYLDEWFSVSNRRRLGLL